MTVMCENDGQVCRASVGGSTTPYEETDPVESSTGTSQSPTRVPLHGPVDTHDVMCAKVIFALCGGVFPHPLLLAQQLLGIEDQDFPEFQLNVAEAGNNCIDIVAAYLTNLRVMQSDEDPNPPPSLALIQPRHAATVASVAAKARDLLSELALARAVVKPRKAPKNKAIESAARAAASAAPTSVPITAIAPSSSSAPPACFAAATLPCLLPPSGDSAASTAASDLATASCGDAPVPPPSSSSDGISSSTSTAAASGTCLLLFSSSYEPDGLDSALDGAQGGNSNSSSGCFAGYGGGDVGGAGSLPEDLVGHLDTSRGLDGNRGSGLTAREEEERLLVALQGPAAAEETLRMVRAKPAGCKSGSTPSATDPSAEGTATATHGGGPTTHHHHHLSPGAAATTVAGGSPRGPLLPPPPPPPPVRTVSVSAAVSAASQSNTYCGGSGRGGGGGTGGVPLGSGRGATAVAGGGAGSSSSTVGASGSGSGLQSALSCPVTGMTEMVLASFSAASSPPSGSLAGVGGMGATAAGVGAGTPLSQAVPPPVSVSQYPQHPHPYQGTGHRRNTGGAPPPPPHHQQQLHGPGGGRRSNGLHPNHFGPAGTSASHNARTSPTMTSAALSAAAFNLQQQQQQQQQHGQQQQQQQQLAVAQLLSLQRAAYGNAAAASSNNNNNNPYGNLAVSLQGAAFAAGGMSPFTAAVGSGVAGMGGPGGAGAGRLDLNGFSNGLGSSMAAAMELVAAQQQAAAMTAAAGLSNSLAAGGPPQHHQFGAAGFGAAALGQLAGQLAAGSGLGHAAHHHHAHSSHHHHHHQQLQHQHNHQQQQQQVAAAAAALLQQGGGLMHFNGDMGVGAGADPWGSMLLQAQLAAGSLS